MKEKWSHCCRKGHLETDYLNNDDRGDPLSSKYRGNLKLHCCYEPERPEEPSGQIENRRWGASYVPSHAQAMMALWSTCCRARCTLYTSSQFGSTLSWVQIPPNWWWIVHWLLVAVCHVIVRFSLPLCANLVVFTIKQGLLIFYRAYVSEGSLIIQKRRISPVLDKGLPILRPDSLKNVYLTVLKGLHCEYLKMYCNLFLCISSKSDLHSQTRNQTSLSFIEQLERCALNIADHQDKSGSADQKTFD